MQVSLKQLYCVWQVRWQQSAERERKMALLVTALMLTAILWITAWTPQHRALLRAEEGYRQELALRQAISQLPQSAAPESAAALSTENLSGLLTRTGSEAQLTFERVDSDAAGQINLSLNGTLDNLIPWLEKLSQQGVTVRALALTVTREQTLSVQLTFSAS